MIKHIHILGASGSGTTTLGRALSDQFGYTHLDSDDYFWLPTDPAYQQKRPKEERQQLISRDLSNASSWIISGSFVGWGDIFIPEFDLVIYLWVPPEVRIKRLIERERSKFGTAVLPGGKMYDTHQKFLEWAGKYDTGDTNMRSKARHQLWLSQLDCPVLKIEGIHSLEENINLIVNKINALEKEATDE